MKTGVAPFITRVSFDFLVRVGCWRNVREANTPNMFWCSILLQEAGAHFDGQRETTLTKIETLSTLESILSFYVSLSSSSLFWLLAKCKRIMCSFRTLQAIPHSSMKIWPRRPVRKGRLSKGLSRVRKEGGRVWGGFKGSFKKGFKEGSKGALKRA